MSLFSQTLGPSVVDTIQVAYKDVGDPLGGVLAEATIHLTTTSNVSKVYYKVLNPSDSSIVYDINYNLSTATITSGNMTLCLVYTNAMQILDPNPLPLQAYIYQAQTEDALGNKSQAYSLLRTPD